MTLKFRTCLLWLFLLGGVASTAQAADAQAVLKDNGCMSCHAKDEKIVGPSFVSIADKYRGDKDAAATLAQSVQNGSKGKWGRVPMPAHRSLSQEELTSLAQHILATKP
jgi:cytochrome c